MPDVLVITDREKEAIYEYSDQGTVNISNQANVEISLMFNQGNRQLRVRDNGVEKVYRLVETKKPEDTGTRLLRFNNMSIRIASDLTQYFPVIDKEQ